MATMSCSTTSEGTAIDETTTAAAPSPATPTLGIEWAPSQRGYGSAEPSEIHNGGDQTGSVFDISWESWGGETATGTGTSFLQGDAPAVAESTREPVTVVAFDLGECHGQPAYLKVDWYFPEHEERFDPGGIPYDICPEEILEPYGAAP
jgi:hypothetical protein